MKKIKLVAIIISMLLVFTTVAGCRGNSSDDSMPSGSTTGEQGTDETKATDSTDSGNDESELDLSTMINDSDNWHGPDGKMFIEDGYITLMGGNVVAGYHGQEFKDQILKFKVKMTFDADWNYLSIRAQPDATGAIWDAGRQSYGVFIKKEGVITLEKWIDGEQTVLLEVDNADFLDESFHDVQFGAVEVNDGVRIVFMVDGSEIFDYVDTNSPITDEGYLSIMAFGSNKVALGGIDAGDYVEPEEEEKTNLAVRDDVPLAQQEVDMMQSSDSWDGWLSDITQTEGGWRFNPDDEHSQYQSVFNDKVYENVEHNIKFKVDAIGEWVMFYIKHITQDTRSAAWGSSEFGPADNYSILMDKNNKFQILKWKNGSPQPLVDMELDSTMIDLRDTSKIHDLTIRVENIDRGGREGVNITVIMDGNNLAAITDFENPYTNPGYFGVQGYSGATITMLEAKATPLN